MSDSIRRTSIKLETVRWDPVTFYFASSVGGFHIGWQLEDELESEASAQFQLVDALTQARASLQNAEKTTRVAWLIDACPTQSGAILLALDRGSLLFVMLADRGTSQTNLPPASVDALLLALEKA